MDIFEMLEILVDLKSVSNKNSDSKIRELEKEGEKEVITINKTEFVNIMAFLTSFYMNEEPKVGITLLKVTNSIISALFDKELRDKILSVSKEEK